MSNFAWPALGNSDATLPACFWETIGLTTKTPLWSTTMLEAPLPYDLNPQGEIELPLTITAPENPGNYVLEVDMVQEGISWFSLKGSKSLRSNIRVER